MYGGFFSFCAALRPSRYPAVAVTAMVRQRDFLNGDPELDFRLVRRYGSTPFQ
jgi:hypothetical protein